MDDTFRHTCTTLPTQNNEDVKVVQELLRHANSRITLDPYSQAGMPEKTRSAKQNCSACLTEGEGTGLSGPLWTMSLDCHLLVSVKGNGGVDGTRTRGLCRDRVTGLLFSTTYMSAETAKVRQSHVRHRILWVGLWVEKCEARNDIGYARTLQLYVRSALRIPGTP